MSSEVLLGQCALVTGGARRLGRAIALELARAGADVIIHHHRSPDDARDTAREIEGLGRRAVTVQADLTQPGDIGGLESEIRRSFPRLDILVNSAAVWERRPLAELEPEAWDAVMALNLRAPYLLSRMAASGPMDHGGSIVNIADVAGEMPWAWHLHYSVSKAGLIAMTRCLALELAPAIRVNAVAPGTVMPAADQKPEEIDLILRRTPLKRLARAEEIGRAVVFLAGSESMTGQIVTVDGGRSIYNAG